MRNRQSIRKPGHDYTAASTYFITICTRRRDPLLGRVADGQIDLSEMGRMVREEWQCLRDRFPVIELDEFVIMPNHVHGIITVGASLAGAHRRETPYNVDGTVNSASSGSSKGRAGASPAPALGQIIGAFKSLSRSTMP
jgi:hypothetical protein